MDKLGNNAEFKQAIVAAWNRLDAVKHHLDAVGKAELAMEVQNMRQRMWVIFIECGGVV